MTSPQTTPDVITAALIVIGDEILSGRTRDKNIGHVADHLTEIGIQLCEVRIVPDIEDRIVDTVNELRQRHTYVFTTGGIGPTHDDITAGSVAKAFGVSIDIDDRVLAIMRPYYEERNMELTDARLRMARIPAGADLIENEVSIAPGFMLENVIVMAGIPNVMHVMLEAVTPGLDKGRPVRSATIVVNRPESEISAPLGAAQDAWPDVSMGSYPFYENGAYGTHLVLRCADPDRLSCAETELRSTLEENGLI